MIKKYTKKARFISRIRRRRVDLRNYEPIRKRKWRLTLNLKLNQLKKRNKLKHQNIKETDNKKKNRIIGFSPNLINYMFYDNMIELDIKMLSKKAIATRLGIIFILSSMLDTGEKIKEKKKNDLILNFFFCIRKKHAIYNINKILNGLRLTITAIAKRLEYRKTMLLNFAQPRTHATKYANYNNIALFAKTKYLVTWQKWKGGILTNFKKVSTRLISRMLNDKLKENKVDYHIAFPNDVPRLPAYVVNATDSHWALNESKSMGLATTQLLETSHSGYFGDINIALNTHYFGLRVVTNMLLDAEKHQKDVEKLFNKNKLILRLDKIINKTFITCLFYYLLILLIFALTSYTGVIWISIAITALSSIIRLIALNQTTLLEKYKMPLLMFFVRNRFFRIILNFCDNATDKLFNLRFQIITDSVLFTSKLIWVIGIPVRYLILLEILVVYQDQFLLLFAINGLFRAIIGLGLFVQTSNLVKQILEQVGKYTGPNSSGISTAIEKIPTQPNENNNGEPNQKNNTEENKKNANDSGNAYSKKKRFDLNIPLTTTATIGTITGAYFTYKYGQSTAQIETMERIHKEDIEFQKEKQEAKEYLENKRHQERMQQKQEKMQQKQQRHEENIQIEKEKIAANNRLSDTIAEAQKKAELEKQERLKNWFSK